MHRGSRARTFDGLHGVARDDADGRICGGGGGGRAGDQRPPRLHKLGRGVRGFVSGGGGGADGGERSDTEATCSRGREW